MSGRLQSFRLMRLLSPFAILISIAWLTCALPTTSAKSEKLPPGAVPFLSSTEWGYPGVLRAFVGKYAFDRVNRFKLVEVPEVRSRIQMLLGGNAPNLMTQWDTSSPFKEHEGWLVAHGCLPHFCFENQWVIAINLFNYNMFICFAKVHEPVKYGFTGRTIIELTPPPLDGSSPPPCPDEEQALHVFHQLFTVPTQSAQPTPVGPTTPIQKDQTRLIADESTSVPMQIEGGIYVVPVLINDAITLNFVVDSGAADVSITADVVMTLMRMGNLKEADFLGEKTYVLADGSKVPSQTFRIKSLKVGSKVLENVTGSIASVKGGLLLGQSFLSRFKSWSIDNAKHALLLSE
jgi:predicted aspartyl protease